MQPSASSKSAVSGIFAGLLLWGDQLVTDPTTGVCRRSGCEIEGCSDKRRFRAYVVAGQAGPPEGMFEIAFSRTGKRACAIFEAVSENGVRKAVVASDPVWVTASSPTLRSALLMRRSSSAVPIRYDARRCLAARRQREEKPRPSSPARTRLDPPCSTRHRARSSGQRQARV